MPEGVGSTTTAVAEWALGVATIRALHESGTITDATVERIITLMEEHADRYERDHHPVDAGEVRVCARRLRELILKRKVSDVPNVSAGRDG